MLVKLNLKTDDRVRLGGLHFDQDLNGLEGTVIGHNVNGLVDFYIILLDRTVTDETGFVHKAVSIPEVCLKRI